MFLQFFIDLTRPDYVEIIDLTGEEALTTIEILVDDDATTEEGIQREHGIVNENPVGPIYRDEMDYEEDHEANHVEPTEGAIYWDEPEYDGEFLQAEPIDIDHETAFVEGHITSSTNDDVDDDAFN